MAFGIIAIGHVRFEKSTFLTTVTNEPLSHRTSNYVIALCVLLICAMQFGLILVKHELRLRLVLTRFSLWRRLQNQTLTTSFSRWRLLAIRAISWEDGLLFSTKLCSRASLAPRLQSETRERGNKKKRLWVHLVNGIFCTFDLYSTHLIVVLLFLFRSFIPILSLYKAARNNSRFCKDIRIHLSGWLLV